MKPELKITPLEQWWEAPHEPLIIAGPCSAESKEQVLQTARDVAKNKQVSMYRAGIWKPRTRPNSFEGVGTTGLKWMQAVRQETGMQVTVEVANAKHTEAALKHNIDVLWIGARTTVNPFSVQEIADALQGTDIPVMVKNPINPDLALWIGALERLNKAGIHRLLAIHRGFSPFGNSKYRNSPLWEYPVELKRLVPEVPIICDPSHICGTREWLQPVSQKAFDLQMAGLMIETHIDPDNALSDAEQQVTPESLKEILDSLVIRSPESTDESFEQKLQQLREQIDIYDRDIIEALSCRTRIVQEIGLLKKLNNVTIYQVKRWEEILNNKKKQAGKYGLHDDFVAEVYQLIHQDSIRTQTEVMNNGRKKD